MNKTVGILLAAGASTRMGADKMFVRIGQKTVIERSMEAMRQSGCFDHLIIVVRNQDREIISEIAENIFGSSFTLAQGGSERQYSVANALATIADAEIIAVHDAARCFAEPRLFCACVAAAREFGAAAVGARTHDTVKTVEGDAITGTIDRSRVVTIQTPQAARFGLLKEAHEKALSDGFLGTDESSLIERLGIPVRLVEASNQNIKITTQEDIMAGQQISNQNYRCGTGYDAHRLAPGLPLYLGGVNVPHTHGLSGHSDADVLLHAIIDALLGAAAAGDIGHHFPETETYRGISSIRLLERTLEIITDKGFTIVNVDATVIMQKPRLAPFVPQIRENIASALQTNIENISVKATTTEGMGFEGLQQGVSAMAVATLLG
jgi:2-C-methyl-D-erythritol 4-phosphate cytidylyltransferase / 2-C-methyl-D-erythritol 2,4-cyclodiphosphate synthase